MNCPLWSFVRTESYSFAPHKAERKRNAVIFIDEIDSIASIREMDSQQHEVSLVGKLLSLMDGMRFWALKKMQ